MFNEGESAKEFNFTVNRDDVYKESDTAEAAITGVSGGGQFEDLDSDNATVTTDVKDDVDTVFAVIEIDGDKKIEEADGAVITFTVKLVDKNGVEVKVLITIPLP
ncbi:immunoglobulin-like domain-containing protein [Enterovibrio coralii]|uniref:immunoglobulin-like domain-containing protein n=1 Tax=Enterovibrio coralii TaxID=294935 RepID=UPI002FC31F8A